MLLSLLTSLNMKIYLMMPGIRLLLAVKLPKPVTHIQTDQNGTPILSNQPVINENGEPVFELVQAVDSEGNPVFDDVPVLDKDGNPIYDEVTYDPE